jgi:hypothetical protein
MKYLAAVITLAISASALAQETDVPGCKLLSDGNGTKVWQCAPTPATNTASQADRK